MLTFCPHCGEIRAPGETVCKLCGLDFATRGTAPTLGELWPKLVAGLLIVAIVVVGAASLYVLTDSHGIHPDVIQGKLVGRSGAAVSSVDLVLVDARVLQGAFVMPSFDLTAKTGQDGRFQFKNVPAGKYAIRVVSFSIPASQDDMFVQTSAGQVLVAEKVDGKGVDLGTVVSRGSS